MYNGNHQVASHTWSHPDLCNITSYQRKNEMWKNEMALRNIIGVIPTYMRPPYSDCTAGRFPSSSPFRANRILLTPTQNVAVKPTSFLSAITLPISYVSLPLSSLYLFQHPLISHVPLGSRHPRLSQRLPNPHHQLRKHIRRRSKRIFSNHRRFPSYQPRYP
jgi:hypothetical protein